MTTRTRWTVATALVLGGALGTLQLLPAAGVAQPGQPAPAAVQFNRDIRPILSDKCFKCHGPDEKNRKAKLRLDDRRVALEKGAIVPGKPVESELVRRDCARRRLQRRRQDRPAVLRALVAGRLWNGWTPS